VDGRLHVVCGPPASGKSTYGRKLARRLGALFLDSDQVGERLVRAGLAMAGKDPDDRDSPEYKSAFRDAVYETLFDLAAAHLTYLPVVIAGPFTREMGCIDWPQALQRRLAEEPVIHWVHCPPEIRRARIESRGESRDLPKLAAWSTYLATCREDPPLCPHVAIDGCQGL
jgi:predicted kinase